MNFLHNEGPVDNTKGFLSHRLWVRTCSSHFFCNISLIKSNELTGGGLKSQYKPCFLHFIPIAIPECNFFQTSK